MAKISVFTDGGARGNPGPAAAGVIIKNEKGEILFRQGKYLGKKTNNEAEYEAAKLALNWLEKNTGSFDQVDFFFDAKLMVMQIQGLWKIKAKNLKLLIGEIQQRIGRLNKPVSFFHLPREENQLADQLVNQTLDKANGKK